jgi:hypothetical protein
MKTQKQAHYNLQISVDSLQNERVMDVESPLPFHGMSIGDKIWPAPGDAAHWFPAGETPKVVFIVDRAHAITDTANMISHQIHIAVSIKPGM